MIPEFKRPELEDKELIDYCTGSKQKLRENICECISLVQTV